MKPRYLLVLYLSLCTYYISAQTWEVLDIPEASVRYDDVMFIDENRGWAADGWGSTVYKTTDGGNSWSQQFTADEYFRSIEFLNEDIGFLGTLRPIFYKTTDGGNHWDTIRIDGVEAICGLTTIGDSTVYGCGAFFQPAYLIKSTDSGNTWTFKDMSEYASSLIEVVFMDELNGFAAGGNDTGGTILKTSDGGETWTEIFNTEIPGEIIWKLQVLFSDPNALFAAVQSFDPLPGKLIKSQDGGNTWTMYEVETNTSDETDSHIQSVGFISENTGWMSGHNSGLKETQDGGETWEEVHDFMFQNINRFLVFNENLIIAAGNSIYKYSGETTTSSVAKTQINGNFPKVSIMPNPFSNALRIVIKYTSADHMLITVFDENGRKLNQLSRETIPAAVERSYSFDFPYPPGIYYIQFHSDRGAHSVKVIKQ